MGVILEKLSASLASHPTELSTEIREREHFKGQLQVFQDQNMTLSELDHILTHELDRRSAVGQSRKSAVQVWRI